MNIDWDALATPAEILGQLTDHLPKSGQSRNIALPDGRVLTLACIPGRQTETDQ